MNILEMPQSPLGGKLRWGGVDLINKCETDLNLLIKDQCEVPKALSHYHSKAQITVKWSLWNHNLLKPPVTLPFEPT